MLRDRKGAREEREKEPRRALSGIESIRSNWSQGCARVERYPETNRHRFSHRDPDPDLGQIDAR